MKSAAFVSLGVAFLWSLSTVERLNAAAGDEHWSPQFGWPGTTNTVYAIHAHQGRVYFGESGNNGNDTYLSMWDNGKITRLATFSNDFAAVIFDIAFVGSTLYVGGYFTSVDGVPAKALARWDGGAWSSAGITNFAVSSLAVSGNDLYVAGIFVNPGGVAATNIARWDGSAWHALGSGLGHYNDSVNEQVYSILVTNGQLYAAGTFPNAGALTVDNIARWDGTNWSALGGGFPGAVVSGVAWDGSSLYACGSFQEGNGAPGNRIARWNGVNWSPLGTGLNGLGNEVAIFNSLVCVGGSFTSAGGVSATNFAVWNGTTWSTGGGQPSAEVKCTYATADRLYIGGNFLIAGGGIVASIAEWDGSRWIPFGNAGKINGLSTTVRALVGDSTNLYAAGDFTAAGRTNALRVGRFDGTNWHKFGNGLNASVSSLALVGTNLYAGGDFTGSSGGPLALRLARWDGSTWTSLNGTAFTRVNRLATRSNDLFVAGYFFNIATNGPTDWLARWDGTNFNNVLTYGPNDLWLNHLDNVGYSALAADGTNVYVSGWCQTSFCDSNLANCTVTDNVRRFDGQYVRPMGSGLNSNATSIAIMGTNIFFAGPFTNAGGVTANRIARWNGTTWSAVGGGLVGSGVINALAVIGTNLYAGGSFTNMGGVAARRIARWDGTMWSPLGGGTVFSATAGPVIALHAVGQDLYVGGTFRAAGDKASYYLARWNESKSFMDPVIRFSGPGRSGNGFFTSTIITEGAPTYAIERSTNFTNWIRVLTSSVTPLVLVDSNAPAGPKQFYRALTPP